MCVSVYIYIHIYNIRASAAGGGRTNRRIPLHHTCKTYTMAMTTTTGNISSCYIYILNCIHAILLILYIIIYFSAVAFPQGPLTKRALAWKLFSKSTQKPPPTPLCAYPRPVVVVFTAVLFNQSLVHSTSIRRPPQPRRVYIPLLQRARYFSFSRFSFLLSSECFQFARRPQAPRVDVIATRSSAKKILGCYIFFLIIKYLIAGWLMGRSLRIGSLLLVSFSIFLFYVSTPSFVLFPVYFCCFIHCDYCGSTVFFCRKCRLK